MIDRSHRLPVSRQCQVLDLPRSTVYSQPVPVSADEPTLMRRIDELHLETTCVGSRMLRTFLRKDGHRVGRQRIRRLMCKMRLEALYRKRNLGRRHAAQAIYPYLLRHLSIDRTNQVWATDITYVPMRRGFVYLVVIMDWYSRRVLAWRLANTLGTDFCVEALAEAISRYDPPEIFNTDQASQFSSAEFADVLKANDIRISMGGKGCWPDNVFVERLWRTVKHEDVYLKAYDAVSATKASRRSSSTTTTVGDRINRLTTKRRMRSTSPACPKKGV